MNDPLTLSPIIAWVGALSLLLNFGLTLWSLLASGARQNKAKIEEHDARLGRHDVRLGGVEQALRSLPAKDDMHGLQLALSEVKGELRETRAIMARMEDIISRHEQHLLEGKR